MVKIYLFICRKWTVEENGISYFEENGFGQINLPWKCSELYKFLKYKHSGQEKNSSYRDSIVIYYTQLNTSSTLQSSQVYWYSTILDTYKLPTYLSGDIVISGYLIVCFFSRFISSAR